METGEQREVEAGERDSDDPPPGGKLDEARHRRTNTATTGVATCARATPAKTVRVAGWVNRRRDHGGLIFIDLRDRSGIVQLVFDPEDNAERHQRGAQASLRGCAERQRRGPERANPSTSIRTSPTGEIEIAVERDDQLADADTPPFPVDEDTPVDETLRLKHRSLDLRRTSLREAIELRHRVVATMREVLDERDFLEIETPFLTRSTPEGARDFLVPARTAPGSFYALPQSPQLFKQLLMIGGLERYYQIVRCFRDEDSRADRLPEFTQLDLEMGFVVEDDVIEVMEAVMAAVFEREGFDVAPPPWPRLKHAEAVERFGSDRPDMRFGIELRDLGDALAGTEFKVFSGALESGGVVRGINAGNRELARSDLDALTELAKQNGAKGLVWAFVEPENSWRSPIAKFLKPEEIAAVNAALDAREGDALLIVADQPATAGKALGALRLNSPSGSALRLAASMRSPGSSSSRCSSGTPRVSGGTRPTTRSQRRPAGPRRSRRRCSHAATTWCSTAMRSAAARSETTAPTSRSGCSS